MTFSVGFRAPSRRDLVAGILSRALDAVDPHALYSDPDLAPATAAGRIESRAVARAIEPLRELLGDSALLTEWFGCQVTEPRRDPGAPGRPERPSPARLRSALRRGAVLRRDALCRFAWAETGGETLLFVAGRAHRLGRDRAAVARAVCDGEVVDAAALGTVLGDRDALRLLGDLVAAGHLFLDAPQGNRRT
jgi:50S ribosomal protein L16 3-hydroxylase